MSVQEFAKTCTGEFTYGKGVLAMGKDKHDIPGIAKELLERIEKECPNEDKYEIALQVLDNQSRMIYKDSDSNDKIRIKQIGEKILEIHSILNPPRKSEEALKEAHKIKENLSKRSSIASDNSSTQPQTGMSTMSEEERQKKIEEDRKKRLADYEASKKSAPKKKQTFLSRIGLGGNKTKKSKKGMSLCAKKTAKKCTKVRGCKVASGKKRTYCRKKKNHTQKSNKK